MSVSNSLRRQLLAAAVLCLFMLPLFGEIEYDRTRRTILRERIGAELEYLTYRREVAENELDYAVKRYMKIAASMKKLTFLERSSKFLKVYCPPFTDACHRLYSMSIVYIRDEKHRVAKSLQSALRDVEMSRERFDRIADRISAAKKGLDTGGGAKRDYVSIPGMQRSYPCVTVDSWNLYRGVFVPASEQFDMPVTVTVRAVEQRDFGCYIVVDTGEYTVHFAYAGRPSVKQGAELRPYTRLFTGSSGNPVMPHTVLVFILKNGQFVDPTFLCR